MTLKSCDGIASSGHHLLHLPLESGGGDRSSKALAADGEMVFKKACELGLEGIVSKRAGGFYRNGRSRNWLKTKADKIERHERGLSAAALG
jgi:ATP-dependent DNA ligase